MGAEGVETAGATADITVSADDNGPLVLVDNGGNVPLFTAADEVKGPLFIGGDDVRGPLFIGGAMGAAPFACSARGDEAGTTGFIGDAIGGASNFRAGVAGVLD